MDSLRDSSYRQRIVLKDAFRKKNCWHSCLESSIKDQVALISGTS